MNCPTCGKPMEIKAKDLSTNDKTSSTYTRTVFICIADDVWITVEIPVKAGEVSVHN